MVSTVPESMMYKGIPTTEYTISYFELFSWPHMAKCCKVDLNNIIKKHSSNVPDEVVRAWSLGEVLNVSIVWNPRFQFNEYIV